MNARVAILAKGIPGLTTPRETLPVHATAHVAALLDVTGLTLHLVELHLSEEGEVVAWVLGQLIELDGGRTGVLRVEMAGLTWIHGRLFSDDSSLLPRVQAWQAGAGERTLQLLTLCPDPGTYNLVTRQLR